MSDYSQKDGWAPIFPITALSKDPKAVKTAAKNDVVRITENGRGAYIFASEEALAALLKREREAAVYEAYLSREIQEGLEDIEAGRFATSRAEMFKAVDSKRQRYA